MVQPATQPSSGWYIEVTNGIGSSSFDTLNLVCADITSIQGDAGQPQIEQRPVHPGRRAEHEREREGDVHPRQ